MSIQSVRDTRSGFSSSKRWLRRPEGSNWGEFGEDDQIGRLNLITPERRLAAMREVREGIAFTLSLPLNCPGGALQPDFRKPPHLASTVGAHNLPLGKVFNAPGAPDIGNDDVVTLSTQYSTQWDGLCHIGCKFDADNDGVAEAVYYNGYRGDRDIVTCDEHGNSAATALGADKMAVGGVQGRAVLLNFRKIYGDQKVLVGYDRMMHALREQNAAVERGDFLCIYTGFADSLPMKSTAADAQRLNSSFVDLDGHDERLLNWITDSGLVAICSDSMAIEAHPDAHSHQSGASADPLLPLHHHCLFKLGINLGELWYLREIAAWLDLHGRTRFLLTAPPLRLPGAVGSPVTPIGTV
jgi:kynurenine formamidase